MTGDRTRFEVLMHEDPLVHRMYRAWETGRLPGVFSWEAFHEACVFAMHERYLAMFDELLKAESMRPIVIGTSDRGLLVFDPARAVKEGAAD